jgi:hypothetical protein
MQEVAIHPYLENAGYKSRISLESHLDRCENIEMIQIA